MAGFMMKQMVGGKLSDMKGALGGDKKEEAAEAKEEDPEVIQARLEQEERRKDKHRQMEREREKMRDGIRNKYNIKKKDEEEMALEAALAGVIPDTKKPAEQDDGFLGKLGLGGAAGTATEKLGGIADTVKGFLPFGK